MRNYLYDTYTLLIKGNLWEIYLIFHSPPEQYPDIAQEELSL